MQSAAPGRWSISTHAPAGGATLCRLGRSHSFQSISTHAPAGGATRRAYHRADTGCYHFYSRPCGRGDSIAQDAPNDNTGFLLTPLREGRLTGVAQICDKYSISTHAPAGGATRSVTRSHINSPTFLLTPLREGRLPDNGCPSLLAIFLLTPLREGRPSTNAFFSSPRPISTHAPAGGATGSERFIWPAIRRISTHAPAGGATFYTLGNEH